MAKLKKMKGQSAPLSQDLLAYYRKVSQSRLTVVDVETTGSLPYQGARVIEVSVLQASLSEGVLHQETHLINPGVRVPAMITRVTGITQSMVSQGVFPEEVWPDCLELLEKGVLTAHNLEFDYRFLKSEYQHLDHTFVRPVEEQLCTVLLSRLLLADLPSRSLPDLVKRFKFDVGPSHRAGADTRACWLLAEMLLKQIQTEPEAELLKRFGRQWIRLQDAAAILKCPAKLAQELLNEAGIDSRFSKRRNRPLYRRGDVERVMQEREGEQLSVL
ncbi:3'-5' exonuclease [Oscillatoria sp. CS-180]|uniref:3'-5' exonuclease n=1 Tax=Oscillatoria sp. CS-180 TaxID=3021720 RepID=UPI00232B45E7|nr:3'-5' exonuclease [Oscillatoria sp. CS-180]MDB9527682.1 3'-5' exonuclease [Oscillatoria sp. CS-180]